MNLLEFWSAACDAWSLLAAFPLHWLAVILVILIAVESLMFVPVVGFVIKLAVAGVVVAQVIAMFGLAAAGQSPSPLGLISGFSLPLGAQVALALAALLPFFAGMLFLYFKAGPQTVKFFFGNLFKIKPPSPEQFVQLKYVMHLAALPLTFLAGAVVIKGLSGFAAVSSAIVAAVNNWLPIFLLFLLALAFEWLSEKLPTFLPRSAAAAVGGILLVAYLAWSLALTYTVSARVLNPAHPAVRPNPSIERDVQGLSPSVAPHVKR